MLSVIGTTNRKNAKWLVEYRMPSGAITCQYFVEACWIYRMWTKYTRQWSWHKRR